MALVAGKFGARAERFRRAVGAHLVVVIRIGGSQGDGFDVASGDPGELARLPAVLRKVAAGIEADLRSPSHDGPQARGRRYT